MYTKHLQATSNHSHWLLVADLVNEAHRMRVAHTERCQQQAIISGQVIAQSETQNAYQVFNRHLGKPHVDVLQKEWSGKLGLKLTPKSLAYTAHRICALESASRGRLATTIEDVTLRALVASAVKNKNLRVLEIGTLFGI